MGKKKKRKQGKGSKHPADKRPGQLIALLVVLGLGILANVNLWFFYGHVVGGNSLPVPVEALPAYRTGLLAVALLNCVMWLLLFSGWKGGFWVAVVLYGGDLLSKALGLNLFGVLVSGVCLYLLLCQSTRLYFRIGQFKAFGPREK